MKKKVFIRDSRSPKPKNDSVSQVMSANKAKDSKPELILRKQLSEGGLYGYRLHPQTVAGRPDIAFTRKKIAIFVHGCYWHHCHKCNFLLPKHNRVFWKKKFSRNQERDEEKIRLLRTDKWKTIVVWEHELKVDSQKVAERIIRVVNRRTLRVS